MFVPDLADQLFQDVLQRDDASGAAVFIHDHGHMVLAFPQGAQQGGDLGHTGSVQRRSDEILQFDVVVPLLQRGKAILLMHNADDVVDRLVVDRKARIAALGEALGHFLHGGIVRYGHHVHAGRQDVLGFHVIKLNGTADQLALAIGQLTVFLGFADHRDQLTFGDGVLLPCIEAAGQEVFPGSEQHVQRRKDRNQKTQHRREGHGHGFGHFLCHAFGGDFAKSQDQQGHDNGGNRRAIGIAHQAAEQYGGKRGRTDVYDIISNQDRAEQAVVTLCQPQHLGGLPVAIISLAFQADLIQRIVRCFSRREEGRHTNQNHQCDNHKYTAIVHERTINSFFVLFMYRNIHFSYYIIDMHTTQRVCCQIFVKKRFDQN